MSETKKKCKHCETELEGSRPNRKYCDKVCAGKWHNANRARIYNALKDTLKTEQASGNV